MPTIDTLFDETIAWRDWRGLSDADLLSLNLSASEPEELPGIISEIREGKLPVPEFDYNMKGRDELVRCAFCRKPNHYIGVVARYEDGARVLVGRICAEKQLGATFKNTLKEFDAAVARQSLLRRKEAVAGYCSELYQELTNLISHPAVESFSRIRKTMRDMLGPLWSDLSRVAENNGYLTVDRQVIDYAAVHRQSQNTGLLLGKQRRRAQKEIESKSAPKKIISENIGIVEGGSFFQRGLSVEAVLNEQLKNLRSVTATLCAKDVPSKDITAAFVKLSNLRQAIATEFERLDALKLAFSPDNLGRIASWLNERSKMRYAKGLERAERQSIYFASQRAFGERGWYGWTVALPDVYHVPEPQILITLSAALGETGG